MLLANRYNSHAIMATKGALYITMGLEPVEVIFADSTCMGMVLVKKGYNHLVAGAWEIGATAKEGDDINGSRTVMGLVGFAGIVYSSFLVAPLYIQLGN